MKFRILSKVDTAGYHTLYLWTEQNEYYLFKQAYRKGVARYYRNGLIIDDAIDYSKAKGNTAVINTMSKLLSHIRYVEKEFGITVLGRTQKNANNRKRKICA